LTARRNLAIYGVTDKEHGLTQKTIFASSALDFP